MPSTPDRPAWRRAAPLAALGRALAAVGLALAVAAPAGAQPFTHPPTDAANVAGVEPRGGLNGSSHVLAVDHVYLQYPNPFNGGADTYPVYAMGNARIVMVLREPPGTIPDPDYTVYLRHSRHVTVQYDHLHGLAPDVLAHLEAVPGAWQPVGDAEILILGQGDAPTPLPVAAGQEIGFTRSHFESWDLGVIDRRVRGGRFANTGLRRYPPLAALLDLAGVTVEGDVPFPGHPTLNSACFLRYMTLPLRVVWTAKLQGPPGFCGRAGWDRPGRVRGAWFNPAVDTAEPPPLFELERAALSIIPDNFDPLGTVQIAIGTGGDFSLIDPAGALPQLDQEFRVAVNPAPGARIDPDPARVGRRTGTVCYHLGHQTGGPPTLYHLLFVRLRNARVLEAHFDDTTYTFPACIAFIDDPPPLDLVDVR